MTTTRPLVGILLGALLVGASAMAHAASIEDVCESDQNKAAGKLASCRYDAHAKHALTGNAAKRDTELARCDVRFETTWRNLEAKAEAQDRACRSWGTEADMRDFVADYTGDVSTALGGGTLDSAEAPHAQRLRTGQTDCWSQDGVQLACPGLGQDGDVRAGVPPFHFDLGEAILDVRTGLTWEKLTNDGFVHDVDNEYVLAEAYQKIAFLNLIRFARHDDWRLPNANELYTLVNLGTEHPATHAAFNSGCTPGCSWLTCSCADGDSDVFWSSTKFLGNTDFQVVLLGASGMLHVANQIATINVRAVRGGI